MKIYEDKAGNRIFKKYIKTREIWQYYAKNRQGEIINPKDFNILAKRARLKIQQVTKSGIQLRKMK